MYKNLEMHALWSAMVSPVRTYRPSTCDGTLWQDRFKSCPVDTDRYLLTVLCYIELNPVRAAMVVRPQEHR